MIIVNGENASGGNGLTRKNADELLSLGIDVITMGNHVWDKRETEKFIHEYDTIVRPANYPEPCPGLGYTYAEAKGHKVCVINMSGLVYMKSLDCPFFRFDEILEEIDEDVQIIIVDFHAEATAEKIAIGYYLDGRVSLVFGTHTHVQTSDNRILENGTGYITDIGMTGPLNGVLGVDKDIIIRSMKTKRPNKYELANGMLQLNGIITEIDEASGKCTCIQNFIKYYPEITEPTE